MPLLLSCAAVSISALLCCYWWLIPAHTSPLGHPLCDHCHLAGRSQVCLTLASSFLSSGLPSSACASAPPYLPRTDFHDISACPYQRASIILGITGAVNSSLAFFEKMLFVNRTLLFIDNDRAFCTQGQNRDTTDRTMREDLGISGTNRGHPPVKIELIWPN